MTCSINRLTFLTLAALLLAPLASLHAAEVANLRCEYLKDPFGINVAKLRLSWVLEERKQETADRGQRQTAYQILVSSSEELLKQGKGDLWDSGKVESDQSIQVEYAGKPMVSRQQCFWQVRAWTETSPPLPPVCWSEPASWSMGLLKPEDWNARWITHPDPKRLSHYSMKLALPLIAGVTSIHMSSARAAEPAVAWWSFDADDGRKDAIIGHHELVPGVRGLALRSNEFETAIECEPASLPALTKGSFTVEAWIAPRAFPWNYCPIIEQRDKTNGFYFGINYQGQLQLEASVGGAWVRCESRAALPGLDENLRFASENRVSGKKK